MTAEERLQAVRDLVVLVTDLDDEEVIVRNDPGPVPSTPYATILHVTTRALGRDTTTQIEAVASAAAVQVTGDRETVYSVQFWGSGSADRAEALRASESSFNALATAGRLGVALVGISPVTDLSEVRETEYEERSGVDVTIRWVYSQTYTGDAAGGTIEHSRIAGTIGELEDDLETDWP
jgi:hypothetical protein